MRFADRVEAGRMLADLLEGYRDADPVVLGIPRGGVPVAAEVARHLGAPLDVVVPRKVGAPSNPELALGAVAPGVRVLDERLLRALRVGPEYLEREISDQQEEIRRRTAAFRGDRDPVDVSGRTAILVDDGVATGSTLVAAARSVRGGGAARTVIAVPVAPAEAVHRLRAEADDVVVVATPEPFYAVGQWYDRFDQLSDDEVRRVLEAAAA